MDERRLSSGGLDERRLGIALVGVGAWGAKILRVLAALPRVRVASLCDREPARLRAALELLRHLPESAGEAPETASRLEAVLADPAVEAMVIATPPEQHAAQALSALRGGRHVFVEKPMALDAADAQAMAAAARSSGVVLMVGHILHHHPALTELRRRVERGDLGELRLMISSRRGMGSRTASGAWWSLGPHDASVARALFGADPLEVSAEDLGPPGERGLDVAGRLAFAGGGAALFRLSSSHPVKTRRLLVLGTRAAAVFDDLDPTGQLKVLPLGTRGRAARLEAGVVRALEGLPGAAWQRLPQLLELVGPFEGGRVVPVAADEPLRCELAHFAAAVERGHVALGSAEEGVAVIEALSAGAISIEAGGDAIRLPRPEPPDAVAAAASGGAWSS